MIARKSLIDKLQKMNLDTILLEGFRRSTEQSGGYRGHAAEVALEKLLTDVSHFSQAHYYTVRGHRHDTPKWFRQLYTELAWATGDITAGSVLQALT